MPTEKKYVCVVLEMGSCIMRVGFAGECMPRSAVEWNKGKRVYDPAEADSTNRISLLFFLRTVFINTLQVRSKDCHVLIVEGFGSSRRLRTLLANILLTDLLAISISYQPDLSMSAVASGHRFGLVLDIGATDCKAIAFADGCVILPTLTVCACGVSLAREVFRRRVNAIACKNLNPEVSDLLFTRVARFSSEEVVQLPASGLAQVGVDVDSTMNAPTVVPVEFISSALLAITRGESSYDGEVHMDDIGGAAGAILTCLRKCPIDIRRLAASRIVVCGGGANIEGLAYRVIADAAHLTCERSLFPEHAALASIRSDLVVAPLYFKSSDMAWIGGSVFATDKDQNRKHFISLSDLMPEQHGACSEDISQSKRLPDWQSVDPKDWAFFSPLPLGSS